MAVWEEYNDYDGDDDDDNDDDVDEGMEEVVLEVSHGMILIDCCYDYIVVA